MKNSMTDRDILLDSLFFEKQMSHRYNYLANECENTKVSDEFVNLLCEEHQIHSNLFKEMINRNWHKTTYAAKDEIEKVKDKFKTTN